MIRKTNAAPVFLAGLVAVTIGCAPASASVPEFSSPASVSGVESSAEQAITTKAMHQRYSAPFNTRTECRGMYNWMKGKGYQMARECRQHADGKWWFKYWYAR
jgi:hypothetical protein